ncbi:hypothetical protein P5673_001553 [Acropora cervicornis]|uniref:Uncharacterized protein n=1 Tax=Acropora cervicornis TaxID=6130 RepID=A0AAD9R635_ACRCE|nr:hypothetical protein P5673_001553 [Acropora cervicornis]
MMENTIFTILCKM